jgi:hypothetical protein
MNLIRFALWLSGIYLAYYLALILWDTLRSGYTPDSSGPQHLTFSEHQEAVPRLLQPEAELAASAVISSGGVSLKQLYSLAKDEAIEYTRNVSFQL